MRPQLQQDDIAQYRDTLDRLKRLEQGAQDLLAALIPEATHYVGDPLDPIAPDFEGTWVNNDTSLTTPSGGLARDAGFYRHLGQVFLTGFIKGGTVATTAFTLPDGYRIGPQADAYFTVTSNAAFGTVIVSVNGSVIPAIGSTAYFSLDGIIFRHA